VVITTVKNGRSEDRKTRIPLHIEKKRYWLSKEEMGNWSVKRETSYSLKWRWS